MEVAVPILVTTRGLRNFALLNKDLFLLLIFRLSSSYVLTLDRTFFLFFALRRLLESKWFEIRHYPLLRPQVPFTSCWSGPREVQTPILQS